jgi:hypothetical protein
VIIENLTPNTDRVSSDLEVGIVFSKRGETYFDNFTGACVRGKLNSPGEGLKYIAVPMATIAVFTSSPAVGADLFGGNHKGDCVTKKKFDAVHLYCYVCLKVGEIILC